MTGVESIVARCALSVVSSVACIWVFSSDSISALSRSSFNRIIQASFIVSRLGVYVLVFLILQIQPRGDVMAYYWSQALLLNQGEMPYRDFACSYAPLHPFFGAGLVRVWSSPLVFILVSILCEWALFSLWLRLGRFFLTDLQVRRAALFCLTAAVSVQFVTVDGQNNVIAALFVGLAILQLQRNRSLLSGLFIGLGVSAVKFLPLIYVPVFFASSSKRWRWMGGLMLVTVSIYGAFALAHLTVLKAFTDEGGMKSAGNLPFLVEAVSGVIPPPRVWDIWVLLAFGVVFALVLRAARIGSPAIRLRVLIFGIAAVTLSLLLFAKKSWPPYLLLALFPICAAIPFNRVSVYLFALFNMVAVAEQSVWASLMGMSTSKGIHDRLAQHSPAVFMFLGLELALLSGYGWLLWQIILQILGAGDTDSLFAELDVRSSGESRELSAGKGVA